MGRERRYEKTYLKLIFRMERRWNTSVSFLSLRENCHQHTKKKKKNLRWHVHADTQMLRCGIQTVTVDRILYAVGDNWRAPVLRRRMPAASTAGSDADHIPPLDVWRSAQRRGGCSRGMVTFITWSLIFILIKSLNRWMAILLLWRNNLEILTFFFLQILIRTLIIDKHGVFRRYIFCPTVDAVSESIKIDGTDWRGSGVIYCYTYVD